VGVRCCLSEPEGWEKGDWGGGGEKTETEQGDYFLRTVQLKTSDGKNGKEPKTSGKRDSA